MSNFTITELDLEPSSHSIDEWVLNLDNTFWISISLSLTGIGISLMVLSFLFGSIYLIFFTPVQLLNIFYLFLVLFTLLSIKRAQTEAVTFLGNQDNNRSLYAIPGMWVCPFLLACNFPIIQLFNMLSVGKKCPTAVIILSYFVCYSFTSEIRQLIMVGH